ncbi:MAG: MCE family protein [Halomonadaceae bacterium]|nr:MAG: MCE family protein [Halomonadaceae bacterium]
MGNSKPALTGLFVVGGLGVLIIGILAFGGLRWFEPSQEAVVYFEEQVGGLNAGAPVTFRGIEMGTVRHLRILADPDNGQVLVRVLLQLRPDEVSLAGSDSRSLEIDQLVAQGLRAQLRPRSLVTGQMAVELDFLPGTTERRHGVEDEPPEIPGRSSDFEQVRRTLSDFPWQDTLETVTTSLNSLKSLSQSLEAEFSGLGYKVKETLSDGQLLIAESRDAVQVLEARSTETMDNFDRFSIEGLDNLERRSEELEAVLASAAETLERVDRVAVEMTALVDPRSPERDDLRRLLRELSSASNNFRRFSEKVEKQPNLLIFDRGDDSP